MTTGDLNDSVPGALGQPNTQVLFGGRDYNTSPIHSGYKLTEGCWLNQEMTLGMEASGFYFQPDKENNFSSTSSSVTGLPILGVPFFNATPPGGNPNAGGWNNFGSGTGTGPVVGENAVLAANGVDRFGVISVNSTSQLWGGEGNVVFNLMRTDSIQVSALLGFRYVDLQENLDLNFFSNSTGIFATQPYRAATFNDHFGTRNQFYGGQSGLRGEWSSRWLYAMVQGKIALGEMHQVVDINGQFADSLPKLFNTTQFGNGTGGIFAQPTNIGRYHQDQFGVIPAGEARIGVNILPTLRVYVGYELLWMNTVARPGDQIDRVINTTAVGPGPASQVPTLTGPARPTALFPTTDFWAQGINFGFQLLF